MRRVIELACCSAHLVIHECKRTVIACVVEDYALICPAYVTVLMFWSHQCVHKVVLPTLIFLVRVQVLKGGFTAFLDTTNLSTSQRNTVDPILHDHSHFGD